MSVTRGDRRRRELKLEDLPPSPARIQRRSHALGIGGARRLISIDTHFHKPGADYLPSPFEIPVLLVPRQAIGYEVKVHDLN
ncbi:MAG TPA: hypothetical protein VG754_03090 [Verrucomicrobiae bacterium]|nr:hypothetical protein [Verrucomicrobiae bacterium]